MARKLTPSEADVFNENGEAKQGNESNSHDDLGTRVDGETFLRLLSEKQNTPLELIITPHAPFERFSREPFSP